MPYDFKKEMKELYAPKAKPTIVQVPKANFIAVQGQGDPNEEGGAYQQAVGILYAVAYTIRMSHKSGRQIPGFFEYVVPPLEGFWQQGAGSRDKAAFRWISVLRLPGFVTKDIFDWAVETASKKKQLDCTQAEFLTLDEGLCVQMLHQGPYDTEPETIAQMDAYIKENGYQNDGSGSRLHHEIYLTNPRKSPPEKWKTVVRHPICRV